MLQGWQFCRSIWKFFFLYSIHIMVIVQNSIYDWIGLIYSTLLVEYDSDRTSEVKPQWSEPMLFTYFNLALLIFFINHSEKRCYLYFQPHLNLVYKFWYIISLVITWNKKLPFFKSFNPLQELPAGWQNVINLACFFLALRSKFMHLACFASNFFGPYLHVLSNVYTV